MLNPKFIHLNVHSDYSLRDGICKIENLLKECYILNIPCIAITDYFNLSSSIKFINRSFFYGIKPIIGLDIGIYFSNINSINFSTLLCINSNGYKNLIKICSIAHCNKDKKNFLYIDFNLILKFSKGLIIMYSINYYNLNTKNFFCYKFSILYNHILLFKNIFLDNFFLQIFRLNHKNQDKYIKDIVNLYNLINFNLVVTNKVLFIKKKDFFLNKIRSCIYNNCSLNEIDNFIDYTDQYFLKKEIDVYNLFFDFKNALNNTILIAENCNFFIKKKKFFLPNFPFINVSSNFFIKRNVIYGLFKRVNFVKNILLKKKYILRIKKELNVIFKLKITNYFLIVMEFVKWSKKNNIFVGPGRGSSVGSLVAYLLYITDIDPIKFDLIFERFLNFERISMPDFDIDFCMNKRDKVISYIESIYGKLSVANIVTFNTMTAKSVVRDVGRVLGYSYSFIDYLAKLIPFGFNISLKKVIKSEKILNDLYKNNKEVKYIIDISLKLEGLIKGIGRHAGGIVISPSLITDFCAVYYDHDNCKLITQFDKNDVEYIGLIKFDLLALKTLSIIDNTINLINKKRKIKNKLYINKISFFDKKSFDLLKNSNTIGVFQLESRGIRELIKNLEPNSFNDIIDLIALFRPGPLKSGMVDNFINRKKKIESIYYPDKKKQHKLLIPILKDTYGIILYQEQVMKIAQVLAGYSLEEADMLRVIISKKDFKNMNIHRKKFINGSILLGINSNLSFKIFKLIEKFTGYSFNKSHSVAYSYISYQTLWLKSNYPAEFLSSYINSDISNIKKIILIITEIKRIGIKIIPLNINYSDYYFNVNNSKNIIYGLGAIKGIGKSSIDLILNLRKKFGKFKSFGHFCSLICFIKISKLVLEKLILSGSLDLFKIDRSILFQYINDLLKIIKYQKKVLSFGQLNLFNKKNLISSIIDNDINKYFSIWNNTIILHKEKETIGFYINNHPIEKYYIFLKKYRDLIFIKDLFFLNKKKIIKIFGLITNIKFIFTKNRDKICLINLDDNTGIIEVLIFKNIYIKYSLIIDINNVIIINGYLMNNINNYNNSFLAKNIILINN